VLTRGIKAYVSRRWDEARAAKDDYWARRIDRLGPDEALRVADELRRQAAVDVPGWPTELDRADDLAAHVRLSQVLRRANRARSS
jgi:hypothetical protein